MTELPRTYISGRSGFASDLKEAGVKPASIPQLVDIAIEDGCHANNPVACTREDFRRIFENALRVDHRPA